MPQKNITARVLTIHPPMAQQMLKRNNCNRKINRDIVLKYASDMRAGKFGLSPDIIMIDEQGYLINGQHRMTACVHACVPFDTMFAKVNKESVNTNAFDSGRMRDVAWVASNAGVDAHSRIVGSAARRHLAFSPTGHFNDLVGQRATARVSATAVAEHIKNNQGLVKLVGKLAHEPYKSMLKPVPEFAALLYELVSITSWNTINGFLTCIHPDHPNSPKFMRSLRTQLLRDSRRKRGAEDRKEIYSKVLDAVEAIHSGKGATRLFLTNTRIRNND